jgi:hypothetical protein
MGLAAIVYLNDVDQAVALDTTKASLGAPGKPGELRYHEHPDYGFQVYRLTLNESGGAIAIGEGVALAAGTAWAGATVDALNAAATVREKFGGVAVCAVADDEWFWALIEGEGLLKLSTDNVAAGNRAFGIDAGRFDDGAVGTIPVGVFLATVTTDNGTARALLTRA